MRLFSLYLFSGPPCMIFVISLSALISLQLSAIQPSAGQICRKTLCRSPHKSAVGGRFRKKLCATLSLKLDESLTVMQQKYTLGIVSHVRALRYACPTRIQDHEICLSDEFISSAFSPRTGSVCHPRRFLSASRESAAPG